MVKYRHLVNHSKYLLASVLLIIHINAEGQDFYREDTIKIREVVISGRQIKTDAPGFRKVTIDSTILQNYNQISLADLLSMSSQLFIKSYGSGGSATSSLRGTGASHTQVSWNGINISNPMLGQSDFSLISSAMADNIVIGIGGASLNMGTGCIGGVIELENKPSWIRGTDFRLNSGIGSFGKYHVSSSIKTGNSRFFSLTRANIVYSENNFPYLNTEIASEPVMETRTNSQFFQSDVLQEFYIASAKNVFSARFWYQTADRNIPGSMLIQSGTPGEKQHDEALRSIISFETGRGETEYSLTGAWVFNRLDYTNPVASIKSLNNTNTITLKGGFTRRFSKGRILRILFNEELNIANSNNYSKKPVVSISSLTLLAEKKAGSRLGSTLLIKEILDNNMPLVPDFSAGLEFRLFPGQDHFIRSGFARTSRIPSMNDRYWYPGGNENLKNEYAYLYDLGVKFDQKITTTLLIGCDISYFRNLIRDMIQWHPGEYAYWTADNLSKVNTSGFESAFSVSHSANGFSYKINAGYTYTRAVSSAAGSEKIQGNQLMYIPEHLVNGSLTAEYRNAYFLWITSYIGKRFIEVDNSEYLPAHSINNFIFGNRISFKDNLVDFNFRIENVFNSSYQTIAYHPQPGRSYHISIQYQLNKKK